MAALRFFAATVGRRTLRFPWLAPPLGIMSLGAVARDKFGAEVKLVNQRLHNISDDDLVREAVDFSADIIALSAFTPNRKTLSEVCASMKAALPDALLVVGGPHPTAMGAEILDETCADIAVPFEGEVALEMIINQYQSDRAWDTIPGIFWRDRKGEVVSNPGKIEPISDLDALPFPAYDLIDLPAYWRRRFLPPGTYSRYITLMSSRGCPYGCKWCHSVFGKKFRAHSAQRIIDEILYFNKTYGVKDFEFQDDIFNMDHARLMEFCDLVHKHNLKLNLSFPNGVRTDIFEEEEIDALVSAGTHFSAFSLETGSPRLQKEMGKRLDIGRFLHNVDYASRKGIFCAGAVMLGFPTETAEEMRTTIDVTCSSALHVASFFNVTPFPNTEVYNMALAIHGDKVKNYDYSGYTFTNSWLNISAEPDEVVWQIQREANKRFYTMKRILRVIRNARSPLQLFLYAPLVIERALKGAVSRK